MNVRWVIQSNLGGYVDDIFKACKNLDIECIPTKVIPFSNEIPNIPNNKPTVFYGATNWVNTIYNNNIWKPGVYFNPESIYTYWSKYYKEYLLNNEFITTTISGFKNLKYNPDKQIFIRPISDQKEFSGTVIKSGEMNEWIEKIQSNSSDFAATPIIVAEPFGIEKEWRLFIVDGKVSSGSQYRTYHTTDIKCKVPKEVIEFGEKMADIYSPSPVFVMDIGRSGGKLYIIEIGCFHSAGFYASNIDKIIKDISEYVLQ